MGRPRSRVESPRGISIALRHTPTSSSNRVLPPLSLTWPKEFARRKSRSRRSLDENSANFRRCSHPKSKSLSLANSPTLAPTCARRSILCNIWTTSLLTHHPAYHVNRWGKGKENFSSSRIQGFTDLIGDVTVSQGSSALSRVAQKSTSGVWTVVCVASADEREL